MNFAFITYLFLYTRIILPGFPSEKMWKGIDLEVSIPNAKVVTFRYYDNRRDYLNIPSVIELKEYNFSKKGELISIKVLNEKTGQVNVQFEFDKYRRITRISGYDTYSIYEYDDKKHISAEYTHLKDGKLITKIFAYYDKWNRILKKETYRENGGLANTVFYTYNKQGKIVQELFVNTPNGFGISIDGRDFGGDVKFTLYPNDTTIFSYTKVGDTLVLNRMSNSKLDLLTKSYSNNDTLIYQEFKYFSYDKKYELRLTRKTAGRIRIESIHSFGERRYFYEDDELKKVVSYENRKPYNTDYYSYSIVNDQNLNWIKKETLLNNKVISRVEREIIYY